MYIEDALGDRVWVDLEACRDLVANMCTLFGTKLCSPLNAGKGGAGSADQVKGATGAVEQGKSGVATKGATGSLDQAKGASDQGKGTTGEDGGDGTTDDVGEVSKEGFLLGIETAPRYVVIYVFMPSD